MHNKTLDLLVLAAVEKSLTICQRQDWRFLFSFTSREVLSVLSLVFLWNNTKSSSIVAHAAYANDLKVAPETATWGVSLTLHLYGWFLRKPSPNTTPLRYRRRLIPPAQRLLSSPPIYLLKSNTGPEVYPGSCRLPGDVSIKPYRPLSAPFSAICPHLQTGSSDTKQVAWP